MLQQNVNIPKALVLNGLFVAFENYFLTFLCTGNHWEMGGCRLPIFEVTGYLHFSIVLNRVRQKSISNPMV